MLRPAFLARLEHIVEASKRGEAAHIDDDILLAAEADVLARRWGVDPRIVMADIEFYRCVQKAGEHLPASVRTYAVKYQEAKRAADEAAYRARRAHGEAASEPVLD